MKALNTINLGLFVVCFWVAAAGGFGWWRPDFMLDVPTTAAFAAAAFIFGWFAVAFCFVLLPLLTAEAKVQEAEVAAYFRDAFVCPGMAALCFALAFGAQHRAVLLETPSLMVAVALLTIAGAALFVAGMIVEDWLAKPRLIPTSDTTTS